MSNKDDRDYEVVDDDPRYQRLKRPWTISPVGLSLAIIGAMFMAAAWAQKPTESKDPIRHNFEVVYSFEIADNRRTALHIGTVMAVVGVAFILTFHSRQLAQLQLEKLTKSD